MESLRRYLIYCTLLGLCFHCARSQTVSADSNAGDDVQDYFEDKQIAPSKRCTHESQTFMVRDPKFYVKCHIHSGNFYEFRLECPLREYYDAVKNKCSSVPGGGQAVSRHSTQICPEKTVGLVPNPDSPHVYHICGRGADVTVSCLEKKFDRTSKRCAKERGEVTVVRRDDSRGSIPVPDCERPGTFAVPYHESYYYRCTAGSYPVMYQDIHRCEDSKIFDDPSHRCVDNSTDVVIPGRNCGYYYRCFGLNETVFKCAQKRCATNFGFDRFKKRCVPIERASCNETSQTLVDTDKKYELNDDEDPIKQKEKRHFKEERTTARTDGDPHLMSLMSMYENLKSEKHEPDVLEDIEVLFLKNLPANLNIGAKLSTDLTDMFDEIDLKKELAFFDHNLDLTKLFDAYTTDDLLPKKLIRLPVGSPQGKQHSSENVEAFRLGFETEPSIIDYLEKELKAGIQKGESGSGNAEKTSFVENEPAAAAGNRRFPEASHVDPRSSETENRSTSTENGKGMAGMLGIGFESGALADFEDVLEKEFGGATLEKVFGTKGINSKFDKVGSENEQGTTTEYRTENLLNDVMSVLDSPGELAGDSYRENGTEFGSPEKEGPNLNNSLEEKPQARVQVGSQEVEELKKKMNAILSRVQHTPVPDGPGDEISTQAPKKKLLRNKFPGFLYARNLQRRHRKRRPHYGNEVYDESDFLSTVFRTEDADLIPYANFDGSAGEYELVGYLSDAGSEPSRDDLAGREAINGYNSQGAYGRKPKGKNFKTKKKSHRTTYLKLPGDEYPSRYGNTAEGKFYEDRPRYDYEFYDRPKYELKGRVAYGKRPGASYGKRPKTGVRFKRPKMEANGKRPYGHGKKNELEPDDNKIDYGTNKNDQGAPAIVNPSTGQPEISFDSNPIRNRLPEPDLSVPLGKFSMKSPPADRETSETNVEETPKPNANGTFEADPKADAIHFAAPARDKGRHGHAAQTSLPGTNQDAPTEPSDDLRVLLFEEYLVKKYPENDLTELFSGLTQHKMETIVDDLEKKLASIESTAAKENEDGDSRERGPEDPKKTAESGEGRDGYAEKAVKRNSKEVDEPFGQPWSASAEDGKKFNGKLTFEPDQNYVREVLGSYDYEMAKTKDMAKSGERSETKSSPEETSKESRSKNEEDGKAIRKEDSGADNGGPIWEKKVRERDSAVEGGNSAEIRSKEDGSEKGIANGRRSERGRPDSDVSFTGAEDAPTESPNAEFYVQVDPAKMYAGTDLRKFFEGIDPEKLDDGIYPETNNRGVVLDKLYTGSKKTTEETDAKKSTPEHVADPADDAKKSLDMDELDSFFRKFDSSKGTKESDLEKLADEIYSTKLAQEFGTDDGFDTAKMIETLKPEKMSELFNVAEREIALNATNANERLEPPTTTTTAVATSATTPEPIADPAPTEDPVEYLQEIFNAKAGHELQEVAKEWQVTQTDPVRTTSARNEQTDSFEPETYLQKIYFKKLFDDNPTALFEKQLKNSTDASSEIVLEGLRSSGRKTYVQMSEEQQEGEEEKDEGGEEENANKQTKPDRNKNFDGVLTTLTFDVDARVRPEQNEYKLNREEEMKIDDVIRILKKLRTQRCEDRRKSNEDRIKCDPHDRSASGPKAKPEAKTKDDRNSEEIKSMYETTEIEEGGEHTDEIEKSMEKNCERSKEEMSEAIKWILEAYKSREQRKKKVRTDPFDEETKTELNVKHKKSINEKTQLSDDAGNETKVDAAPNNETEKTIGNVPDAVGKKPPAATDRTTRKQVSEEKKKESVKQLKTVDRQLKSMISKTKTMKEYGDVLRNIATRYRTDANDSMAFPDIAGNPKHRATKNEEKFKIRSSLHDDDGDLMNHIVHTDNDSHEDDGHRVGKISKRNGNRKYRNDFHVALKHDIKSPLESLEKETEGLSSELKSVSRREIFENDDLLQAKLLLGKLKTTTLDKIKTSARRLYEQLGSDDLTEEDKRHLLDVFLRLRTEVNTIQRQVDVIKHKMRFNLDPERNKRKRGDKTVNAKANASYAKEYKPETEVENESNSDDQYEKKIRSFTAKDFFAESDEVSTDENSIAVSNNESDVDNKSRNVADNTEDLDPNEPRGNSKITEGTVVHPVTTENQIRTVQNESGILPYRYRLKNTRKAYKLICPGDPSRRYRPGSNGTHDTQKLICSKVPILKLKSKSGRSKPQKRNRYGLVLKKTHRDGAGSKTVHRPSYKNHRRTNRNSDRYRPHSNRWYDSKDDPNYRSDRDPDAYTRPNRYYAANPRVISHPITREERRKYADDYMANKYNITRESRNHGTPSGEAKPARNRLRNAKENPRYDIFGSLNAYEWPVTVTPEYDGNAFYDSYYTRLVEPKLAKETDSQPNDVRNAKRYDASSFYDNYFSKIKNLHLAKYNDSRARPDRDENRHADDPNRRKNEHNDLFDDNLYGKIIQFKKSQSYRNDDGNGDRKPDDFNPRQTKTKQRYSHDDDRWFAAYYPMFLNIKSLHDDDDDDDRNADYYRLKRVAGSGNLFGNDDARTKDKTAHNRNGAIGAMRSAGDEKVDLYSQGLDLSYDDAGQTDDHKFEGREKNDGKGSAPSLADLDLTEYGENENRSKVKRNLPREHHSDEKHISDDERHSGSMDRYTETPLVQQTYRSDDGRDDTRKHRTRYHYQETYYETAEPDETIFNQNKETTEINKSDSDIDNRMLGDDTLATVTGNKTLEDQIAKPVKKNETVGNGSDANFVEEIIQIHNK